MYSNNIQYMAPQKIWDLFFKIANIRHVFNSYNFRDICDLNEQLSNGRYDKEELIEWICRIWYICCLKLTGDLFFTEQGAPKKSSQILFVKLFRTD